MNGIFITGTGTDVGKTYVTGHLLRALRAEGIDVLTLKPVQTGCPKGTTAPDLAEHWRIANWTPEPALAANCAPFCFEEPASPHLAAALEGERLTCSEIVIKIQRQMKNTKLSLVEGAGGVLVPLNETETMLDLMGGLRLPVLAVAAAGLGTINHTLLTLQALSARKLDILGVVLSVRPSDPPDLVTNNAETIAAFGKVPVYRSDQLHGLTQVLLGHLSAAAKL